MKICKVTFEQENCKGCELCATACPKKIIALNHTVLNQKGYHPVGIMDMSQCIGCACCALMCPEAIISVEREN